MIRRNRLALCFLLGMSLFCSCHVVRFFIYNFADIRDYKKFPKIAISKQGQPFVFTAKDDKDSVKLPATITVKKREYSFQPFLDKTKTVAFIVIRNDTVLYQYYGQGYTESSIVPSFSMAKSFVSMLLGIAIDEGAIKDVHEPITKYLPELTAPGFEKITIEDLLNMRSGIRFNEGYLNPFGDVAKYYYGVNLNKYITKLKTETAPDQGFKYKSVNSQLLAMIVERAVHKHLADYMEEKVWRYLGAEYDASWSIDSKKDSEVKGFCCFNARARDFAKIGRLYLHNGNWNGKQIISEKWVKKSLDAKNKNGGFYSYQWWHTLDRNANGSAAISGDFFADGLLDQFIYVYPEKNIVIVRLGKKEGLHAWPALMKEIARAN